MDPGQVWLNLIPVFDVVWMFVTVIRLADSLRTEFADRQLDEELAEGSYGKTLGMAWLVMVFVSCGACCLPIPLMAINGPAPAIFWGYAVLRFVLPAVLLALFVLYWVRIAGYGRQLVDDDEAHDRAADEYDDRLPPEESADDRRD